MPHDAATWTDLHWPLMYNNVTRQDLDALIEFLHHDIPRLTQAEQVEAFEREWSTWLGVKHSVFVNSGSSANLLTLAALREHTGPGEIIVPALTWVSDIAAVLHCGFTPVFVDSDPSTLGMDPEQVLAKVTSKTRAVFLTHVLGLNALTDELVGELTARGIPLIEDACESHGATFRGRKVGTFGLLSNFSFYFAHHMSTIEGGMICTDDPELYQTVRMMRSHGLVRESTSEELKRAYARRYADLHPDFIFAFPAYNVRSTELNAVIGRSQLRRLDANIAIRRRNFQLFLDHLDPDLFRTDFQIEGNSNYALILVLQRPDPVLRDRVAQALRGCGVEYRQGLSGGGNQLRQPYLRHRCPSVDRLNLPVVDHLHFYGFYLGNYPELPPDHILTLCRVLNGLGSTGICTRPMISSLPKKESVHVEHRSA
ncbi:MAG: DegT/DnrJ/EryC1/StrS family aminotransferase [Nitrospirae bacterium]|nr:MAG: DegT/DnrJ/EryC1/StrS family aminotransferase [Nitrospirota bacterium]